MAVSLSCSLDGIGTATLDPYGAEPYGVRLYGTETLLLSTALGASMSGVGTLTGTLSLSGVALSGTLAGAGTLSGTLQLSTALTATCAGVGTLSGTAHVATALTATLAGKGVLSASNYDAVVLADSPIRYYRLGESSGTVASDLGSQAQQGTLHGGVALSYTSLVANNSTTPATPRTSMLFDGSTGSISAPTTGLPSGASPTFSMECWYYHAASLNGVNYPTLVTFGDTGSNNVILGFDNTGTLHLYDSGAGVSGGIPNWGTIHHAVATYDGTTALLYVDGVQVGSNAHALTINLAQCSISLAPAGNYGWFPGMLQAVAIYSTALSAGRVLAHYNAGRQAYRYGQLFPANNVWNRTITDLPVHTSNSAWQTAVGGTTYLHVKTSTGNAGGFPFNVVDSTTPTYSPTLTFAAETYTGPFPLPDCLVFEEPGTGGSDHHIFCLNIETHVLYEMTGYTPSLPRSAVTAVSAWNWDLTSNVLPTMFGGQEPVAANAASLPTLVGTVFYDEIVAGAINHALYIALPHGLGYGNQIWPATHGDGSTAGYPPEGVRMRLKASTNISGYSAVNQVILTALKTYGGLLCDSGTFNDVRLQAAPDTRWNLTDLANLNALTITDFEFVDESAIMVSSLTMQVMPPAVALILTCAGVGTLTGALSLTTTLASTLAGVGTLSPTLTAALTLTGATMPGVGTLAGTLSLAAALTDTLASIGTLAGTLSLKTALTTTLSGVGTLTGGLSGGGSLSGTLTGVGTLTAALSLSTALAATMSSSGVLIPTLTASITLGGTTMSGAGLLTGTMQLSTALSTTLISAGTLTATMSANVALTASVPGVGTLSGTLSLATALGTTLTGVGTLSGALAGAGALAGTLAGAGQLAGTLVLSTALAVSFSGTGTLTGVFSLRVALSLTFAGMGTLTGAITVPVLAYLSATAVTRDMQATAKTRDMLVLARTRDEKAIAKTRG